MHADLEKRVAQLDSERARERWIHEMKMKELGALEPKPGVEPGSSHLAGLLERQKATPARMILRAAYSRPTAADWLGERAGIPVVVLPFTVGGSPAATDLVGLFDDTVQRLLAGLR